MNEMHAKEQLGMSYGSARGRLDRIIMFEQAKRLGELNCYRCGKPIESVKDFTVDHKHPWLHMNADLFWSLENIAFSHHVCNSKHHRYMGH